MSPDDFFNFLASVGIFSEGVSLSQIDECDQLAIQAICKQKTTSEIFEIHKEHLKNKYEWLNVISEYRESVSSLGNSTAPVEKEPVQTGVVVNEKTHKDLFYKFPVPDSHELIVKSLFGLPIFSMEAEGQSLENLPKDVVDYIVERVDPKYKSPHLVGVTLNPTLDARIFRGLLSSLRSKKDEDFVIKDETGAIVQPGSQISLDYYKLFKDETIYSHNTVRNKVFQAKVRKSLERISQLLLSYRSSDYLKVYEYDKFFEHLKLDAQNGIISFRANIILKRLFHLDSIESLNTKLLDLPRSNLASIILYYLVSIPKKFSTGGVIEIRKDVSLRELVCRVYPDDSFVNPEEQRTFTVTRSKIQLIKNAMLGLKTLNLIDYEMTGRGSAIVYVNVKHYCEKKHHEMLTEDLNFNQIKSPIANTIDASTTVYEYLKNLFFPRRSTRDTHIEFSKKHIPQILNLIDASTDEALKLSFKSVTQVSIIALEKRAHLIEHEEFLKIIDRIKDIRSFKDRTRKTFNF
ncbi:hypothetical protein [Aliivibrio fischeri]|uniref:hypothetical protein n=1 Tax=Aliivibrio fischeri TaxID=668 RepID=UPI0007C4580E|nr:hypothetical protein [Aliivibrio fischeri]